MPSSNSYIHKITIGTANFGQRYGINEGCLVTKNTASFLIRKALDYGVKSFDCAEAYGDVHSLLGEYCAEKANLITKVPLKSNLTSYRMTKAHIELILEQLKRNKIEAVLLHSPDALSNKKGRAFFQNLIRLKNDNLVSKVGVSVYTLAHIEEALRYGPPDVIQLPFSPLDTRFEQQAITSTLEKLGVEIHVRSIFLQGLILMRPSQIPKHLLSVSPHVSHIQECAKSYDLSPAGFCLSFALSKPWVSRVVVGINNEDHLNEIVSIANHPVNIDFQMRDLPVLGEEVLNPSMWGAL